MNASINEDDKFINLDLSGDSDRNLFQVIANELSNTFNVQWKTQADGLDQRYWDFEMQGTTLTLHLEHYLGISIFADKNKTDYEKAKRVLMELETFFKTWNPTD